MSCYEHWARDTWNEDLIWRVTDVNADRSNQFFQRPRAATGQGCQVASIRLDQLQLDSCNLANFKTENTLRQMHLINNRDILDHNYQMHCGREIDFQTVNQQLKHPLVLRERTKEYYRTLDNRNPFFFDQLS